MPGPDPGERICTTCGAPADRDSRFCSMCGSALSTARDHEGVRRTVVILFADLVGFTSISEGLDPEVLRTIMDRYFRMVSTVIWNYGGTTEKFIGDAVMAVFGMPVIREDDAYRAVHAAWDLVTELETLNESLDRDFGIRMTVRVGVHSGPVSASYDTNGNFRVVGDAVNTASRLQSAAGAQQVIVGPSVAQVIRSRVELMAMAPLVLKGKELPVPAWRVVSMSASTDAAARKVPFIGRDLELLQLRTLVDSAFTGRRGGAAALLGPPGIGKTRLVEEVCAAYSERSPMILTGRAHSYGRGVTYRPIIDMLASAPAAWEAFERLAETDPLAARALACLAGLSRAGAGGGAEVEEIAWALRTFVAGVVEHTPLVLVWEDLHWAEPTLLDVIDFLGDELPELRAIQICIARPELLDARPAWANGGSGTLTLELGPLAADHTHRLVEMLAQSAEVMAHGFDDTCTRVAAACEGNPLYAELMMDMVEDDTMTLPHSVQAVLAARLDRLESDERRVLEMAAVAGRDFVGPDVEYLVTADDRTDIDVPQALDRLRRARLLTGSRLSARYTFAQAFSRDTTYELTAKRDRLRWHLALSGRPYAADDMPVYHLESALLLTRELHPNSPMLDDLAMRAGAELTEEARNAMNRKDLRAAVGLFERARAALPAGDAGHLQVTVQLSDTLLRLDDRDRACAVIDAHPGLDQERGSVAVIEVQKELIDCRAGRRTVEAIIAAERRLEALLTPDDALGWCLFHQVRAHRHLTCEQVGSAEASLATALGFAGDDTYQRDRIRRAAGELMLWGLTPVVDGLRRCEELVEQFADSRVSLVPVLATKAGLLALDGRFPEARDVLAVARVHAAELRMQRSEVGFLNLAALIESLAGAPETAAGIYDRARAVLANAGLTAGAALLEAYALRELITLGAPLPESVVARAEDDSVDPRLGAMTSVLCALAASGRDDDARTVAYATRAVAYVDTMDDVFFRGCIHRDVASALARVGRTEAARAEATRARALLLAKGARAALPAVDALITGLAEAGSTMAGHSTGGKGDNS